MIEIIDILKDDHWRGKVVDSIPEILESGHKNAQNYKNLEERLPLYDCFTAVVDKSSMRLLAISGLFNGGIYPKTIARILDRTYYYDWKDNLSSQFKPEYQYNTNIVIPYQIKIAKERGYGAVFFSMQTAKTRNSLRFMANRQKQFKFEVLDGMYNTCKLINGLINNSELCWQNVAVHYIDNIPFTLPAITVEEYNERY